MVLFKDIHKRVDDLLNKDWSHGSAVEIENNWKAADFSFKNKASVTGGIAVSNIIPNLMGAASCPAMTSCCGGGSCSDKASSTPTITPTFSSEITYDQPSASYTFKFDSAGNTTKELKLKSLFSQSGLTFNNKFAFKTSGSVTPLGWSGYEATLEYLRGDFHSQVSLNPCNSSIVLNTVYSIDKSATIGAEISGLLPSESPAKNSKVGISGVYKFPPSTLYGESRVGVKASQEISSSTFNKAHIHAYIAVKQNMTESAFHLTQQLNKTGASPALVFVAKHDVSKDTSVKIVLTDTLAFKSALHYKASSLLNASLGLGFDQKTGAQAGFKFAFNQ